MKDVRVLLQNYRIERFLFLGIFLLLLPFGIRAEGSVDFINYPGMRLFLWPQETHQLKVYANEGEFINVGASHVGITGGFITVYRPDGTVHTVYDDSGATAGLAIINNDTEELGGPTGGGTTMGTGYEPGIVDVQAGEAGVWTIMMEFPTYNGGTFANLPNNAPWDRMVDQPTIQRTILAWDITISQDAAGNEGGTLLEGRVYANKFASMVSQNGNTTSPTYFVLTKQGFQYQVDCNEIDPYGFPIHSNTTGVVTGRRVPLYKSIDRTTLTTSNDFSTWVPDDSYLYDPMAQDKGVFINNKIFFNIPNEDLPTTAMVTDIINNDTQETWLLNEPNTAEAAITDVSFVGVTMDGNPCQENTLDVEGTGAYVKFSTNVGGNAKFSLDINNDGDYLDPEDKIIYQPVNIGQDSIFWDGLDGMGNPIPEILSLLINFDLTIRGGETHILMADVENNGGGVIFTRLNGPNAPISDYYFDHSDFDPTAISGGGAAGDPKETTDSYTYSANWGNDLMLDYWSYVPYNSAGVGSFDVAISADCTAAPDVDSDGDGVVDLFDIDDDNDGILDALEYCNPEGSFACLTNGLDPSTDDDGDRILNYVDADLHDCEDLDGDGACDQVPAEYDTDGDNIPDYLDVDSDNDGITDMVEAGHFQLDADGNGVIDGMPADFGDNGFYNAIATDPNDFSAQPTYTRWDVDFDGIPDHDDLDSDNDGINDVAEAGFGQYDTNNDGRIDDGAGNIPTVGTTGLVSTILDPVDTGMPVPMPQDYDGDMIPDWHDWDSDNDGINDVAEGGSIDPDNDGMIGMGIPTVDTNGMATADADGTMLMTTSMPTDYDSDLIPDWHDLDSDNDGINDVAEAGFADDDNDGLIGMGIPSVNVLGQALDTAGAIVATSNPLDTDADMIPDWHDLDSDNDGINDVTEGGNADPDNDGIIGMGMPVVDMQGMGTADAAGTPVTTTSNPQDYDMDGIPDWHDLDSDNDGINDVTEGGNADPDNDGIIGMGMPVVDMQGMGTADAAGTPVTTTSNPQDYDMDGIPDWHDLDSDNDGINDVTEGGNADPDNDGIIGVGTPMVNEDGMATADGQGTPVMTTSNPVDNDMDGIPDWHDLDSDNDGINDVTEGGNSDPDNDGIIGTGIPMVDTNGMATASPDGTPLTTTSTPPDNDNDGIPDWHDLDSDNDGINDVVEGGNSDPDNDGIIGDGTPMVNPNGQATTDANGNPLTPTSNPLDTDNDGDPDYLDLDSDNDGLTDVYEAGNPDPDNDGIIGDGTPVVNTDGQITEGGDGTPMSPTSNPIDEDGDGTPDFQDIDSDNDGIDDNEECPNGVVCPDSDDDGIPDWHDTDSDEDGISDAEECDGGFPCPDEDGDGTPDVLEYTCWEMTTPVIADMIGDGVYCQGDELTLSAINSALNLVGVDEIHYRWTGPNSFVYMDVAETVDGNFDVFIPSLNLSNEGPYTLILTTNKGCESEPLSLHIDVKPMPETPIIEVDQDVLCNDDLLELNTNAYTGEEVRYEWFFNNGSTVDKVAETTIPTLFIDEVNNSIEGIYTLGVTVDGCESRTSNAQDIIVIDDAHIGAEMDEFEGEFDEEILVENLDANDYFDFDVIDGWDISVIQEPQSGVLTQNLDGTFSYMPDRHFYGEDMFSYELCSTLCPDVCDETDVLLRITDREEWEDCFIPNIVTPNNDGYNDELFIPCAVNNTNNEIKIFNRWGDKVYESISYANNWRGTYNNIDLPSGTYFYVFTTDRNTGDSKSGYITLMR